MHPDRRRRGRAIRRQRRLFLRPGSAFIAISVAAARAAAGIDVFALSVARAAASEQIDTRLAALGAAYHLTLTTEWTDMITVTITAPAHAPQDLLDHLSAFAHDLASEGITAAVEIVRACKVCGCTDDRACFLGCDWVDGNPDLCTSCAPADNPQEHPDAP